VENAEAKDGSALAWKRQAQHVMFMPLQQLVGDFVKVMPLQVA
jgi:hypothetical protein